MSEWLLPELGKEAGGGTGEVDGTLVGEEVAVNLNVVLQPLGHEVRRRRLGRP